MCSSYLPLGVHQLRSTNLHQLNAQEALFWRRCYIQVSEHHLSYGIGKDFGSGTVYHKIKGRTDLQKGGYAGSRRRTVIGLGLILGPTPRKCGRESTPGCAARIRSLMGKAAHLCGGITKSDMLPPVLGIRIANATGKGFHEDLINR